MEYKKPRFSEGDIIPKGIKKAISGNNEKIVRSLIESLGYVEGEHFIWQYPVDHYILDFAFPMEKVCIEADGKEHLTKNIKKKDYKRDMLLYGQGWVVIRVETNQLDSYKLSFYRNLIREVMEDKNPLRLK